MVWNVIMVVMVTTLLVASIGVIQGEQERGKMFGDVLSKPGKNTDHW